MQNFKDIFHEFTSPYLQEASNAEKCDFKLKQDHSYDVFENSVEICRSLNLDSTYAETVQVAALFHDTGRFPQYKKYGTFKDSESCNHATLGVRYILRKDLLNSLPPERLKIILGAIALHNRNKIPSYIPKKISTAAQIVRDSDKIDILKVLLSHMTDIKEHSNVALMGLTEIPGKISEALLCALEEKRQASYLDMKCVNDFRLLILSWAYDLNFKWSRCEMIKRGYVDSLFEQLPKTKRILALYDPVLEKLNS